MRAIRELELFVGAAFLLGPMVYALTLSPEVQQCDEVAVVAQVEVCECSEPPVEAPAVELQPSEPSAPPHVESPHATPREFMFVAGDGQFVVLDHDVDRRWGHGELFGTVDDGWHRAAKVADPARVSAADWPQGRQIDLYDGSGKRCSAKIARLLVVAQYGYGSEDLGLEFWDDDVNARIEYSPEQLLRATWKTQPHWLVGELDSSCPQALWARDAALPAPTILVASEQPNATTQAKLGAFERSSAVADLREAYEAHRMEPDEELEDWNTRMAGQRASVEAWIDPTGHTRFVELNYGIDDYGCGYGYDTEITQFDAVRGETFEPMPDAGGADAIFDADLDGRFEMLFIHGSYRDRGWPDQAWGRTVLSETKALKQSIGIAQDFFCPC